MFHDLIMEELDDLTIDEFHVDHLKMKYMKLEEFE